jgi:hypothetical protein
MPDRRPVGAADAADDADCSEKTAAAQERGATR